MPVPEGDDEDGPSLSETQKKKKKRKGQYKRHVELSIAPSLTRPSSPILSSPTVLAHEKLFLDHLPSADRYYKSFMHRDVVNTISVTKSV